MTKTLKRRIKQLEEKNSYKHLFPTITFDLVKLIVEQRKEIERLRSLSDAEFEAYLTEAEKRLLDPTDESTLAKRAALRCILKEKMQEKAPSIPSELSSKIQSLD